MKKTKILLFGTGPMAYEYARVLKYMDIDYLVIGRGQKSAKIFQQKTGVTPITGGAAKFLNTSDYSSYKAIVAVTGDQLGNVTLDLIRHRIKTILVEKPGGLNDNEIKEIQTLAQKHTEIYIAYNRRFYSSTRKAQEIIAKDGGVLSFHFEFNEPASMIGSLDILDEIKKKWLFHNSSHVIDLAFFLCGNPKSIISKVNGYLKWHPAGAIFTGFGETENNIPFTYHANWLSPGRWGIEIMTKNYRLIFRPMEQLQAQRNGSFDIVDIKLDNKLDVNFKPGLFKEVESFLNNKQFLCSIDQQVKNIIWYNNILQKTD